MKRKRLAVWMALSLLGSAAGGISQTVTTFFSFSSPTNGLGAVPCATLSRGGDGTLYGCTTDVTYNETSPVHGVVFKVQPNGSGFTVVKTFGDSQDGWTPWGGVALDGEALYGVTSEGGAANKGTVFRLNTDGSDFTVLRSFTGPDGAMRKPELTVQGGALALAGNTLFGITPSGGLYGLGTVFKINTDGTGFAVLQHFDGTNGASPYGPVLVHGGALYGTTYAGGSHYGAGKPGYGVVYKLLTDGSGFSVLHNFYDDTNNVHGRNPAGGLVLSGNTLFGTTIDLVRDDEIWTQPIASGTVFRINTDGSGYATLKKLQRDQGMFPGTLALDGNTLYGTTVDGPGLQYGTLFQLSVDGTGFKTVKFFDGLNAGGRFPGMALLLVDRVLYGTTQWGGAAGYGTLFSVRLGGAISAPVVTSAGVVEGKFRIAVSGEPNVDYVVEACVDVAGAVWTPVWRTNSPTSPFYYTDPDPAVTARKLYRAGAVAQ